MAILSPEAVTRLWDEHSAALVLYARQWCDTPEDVVQEAFLLLARGTAAPENLVGWMYRVVRNRAINAARSCRRQSRREIAVGRPQPAVVCFRPTGTAWTLPRRPARWRNFPPISARRSSPACGAAFPSRKSPASAAVPRARSIAVINEGLRPCEKGSVGHVQRRKRRRRPEGIRAGDGCAPPAGRPARPGLAVAVGQGGFPDGGARGSPEPSAGESGPLRSPGGSSVCLFHCGGDAPQPGGVGRWAWPGALAAMTSVAAVLLAMLLVGRHDRSVGREGPSIAATAAIPATQAKGEVASVTEQAETPPEGPAAADFPGIVPQSVAWRGRSNRGDPYGRRHRVGRRPLGPERLAGEPHGRIDRRRGSGRCPRHQQQVLAVPPA